MKASFVSDFYGKRERKLKEEMKLLQKIDFHRFYQEFPAVFVANMKPKKHQVEDNLESTQTKYKGRREGMEKNGEQETRKYGNKGKIV